VGTIAVDAKGNRVVQEVVQNEEMSMIVIGIGGCKEEGEYGEQVIYMNLIV
jgi:hypothetical protein